MTEKDPYDPKDLALIEDMCRDEQVIRLKRALFDKTVDYRYSYNFTWLGRPIIQYPDDLVALQEIVWKTQPDLVFETGIAHGGSLIFWASLLKLMGGNRSVLGVDIDIREHNRAAIEAHPLADMITMIEGSSVDASTISAVFAHARKYTRPLVVLDSNHTHEHVLAELRAYAPLVGAGSYVIVMDTSIEYVSYDYPDRPWSRGNSPLTAVRAFLSENDRFEVDPEYDNKLLLTEAPSGYLRCTADPPQGSGSRADT